MKNIIKYMTVYLALFSLMPVFLCADITLIIEKDGEAKKITVNLDNSEKQLRLYDLQQEIKKELHITDEIFIQSILQLDSGRCYPKVMSSSTLEQLEIENNANLFIKPIGILIRLDDGKWFNVPYEPNQTASEFKDQVAGIIDIGKDKLLLNHRSFNKTLQKLGIDKKLNDLGIKPRDVIDAGSFFVITVTYGDVEKKIRVGSLTKLYEIKAKVTELLNAASKAKKDAKLNDFLLKSSDGKSYLDFGIHYSFKPASSDFDITKGLSFSLEPKGIIIAHEKDNFTYIIDNIPMDQILQDSIDALRGKVKKPSGVSSLNNYYLIYNNEVILENDKNLSNYDISLKQGDMIYLREKDNVQYLNIKYKKNDIEDLYTEYEDKNTGDEMQIQVPFYFTKKLKNINSADGNVTFAYDDVLSLSSLKSIVAAALPNSDVEKFILKIGEKNLENLSDQELIEGIKSGQTIELTRRDIIEVNSINPNKRRFNITYDKDKTIKNVFDVFFAGDTNADIKHYDIVIVDSKNGSEEIIKSDNDSTKLTDLSLLPNEKYRIEFRYNLAKASTLSSRLYENKVKISLLAAFVIFTGAYTAHRIRKTDWFSRWWYDRLGRYKKLTKQRQEVVMTQLAELYVWREEHLAHEQTEESREKIQVTFEAKKEQILRPFSPEDREKLGKDFEEEREKSNNQEKQDDKPVEA